MKETKKKYKNLKIKSTKTVVLRREIIRFRKKD